MGRSIFPHILITKRHKSVLAGNATKDRERFSSCIQRVWDLYVRDPDTLLALQVAPCIWWSKDKKAAQAVVALCQSANLSCNVATAVGLHKHPLPLVQVRIRSTSILLLWHTGIAVRTATEINPFFCQQCSCTESCLGFWFWGTIKDHILLCFWCNND